MQAPHADGSRHLTSGNQPGLHHRPQQVRPVFGRISFPVGRYVDFLGRLRTSGSLGPALKSCACACTAALIYQPLSSASAARPSSSPRHLIIQGLYIELSLREEAAFGYLGPPERLNFVVQPVQWDADTADRRRFSLPDAFKLQLWARFPSCHQLLFRYAAAKEDGVAHLNHGLWAVINICGGRKPHFKPKE